MSHSMSTNSGAERLRAGQDAQPLLFRAVEHAPFAQRTAGHDRAASRLSASAASGSGDVIESRRSSDQIGVGLGGDARLPNGVAVLSDHGDAQLAVIRITTSPAKKPLNRWIEGASKSLCYCDRALALRPLVGRIPPPIRRKGRTEGGGRGLAQHDRAKPNTGRARFASPASKSCYKGLHTMKIRVFS